MRESDDIYKMKILFVVSGSGGFPEQGAYANRTVSMAKGLSTLANVTVDMWIASLGKHNLSCKAGIYEGIDYTYMNKPRKLPVGLGKYLSHVGGALKSTIKLLIHRKQYDVVVFFVHGLITVPLWFTAKALRIPIVKEMSEFPNSVLKAGKTEVGPMQLKLIKIEMMAFDGFIVISRSLKDFLCDLFPLKKYLIVPINVQPERFLQRIETKRKYITYTGTLSRKKDGVDILIKAFAILNDKYKDLYLRLIGGYSSDDDEQGITSLIQAEKLETKVEITGWQSRDTAAGYIMQAYILVLPRPQSIQAQGGFPTKLGEYLASGIPTLATRVGDIPNYLEDMNNAFLCSPDSLDELVGKLEFIHTNFDFAQSVAEKGKELALTVFNYKKQAEIILRYLQDTTKKD